MTYNYKKVHGGLFETEEHAAMKVNLLCDKYGIKRKNQTIDLEPHAMKQVMPLLSIETCESKAHIFYFLLPVTKNFYSPKSFSD